MAGPRKKRWTLVVAGILLGILVSAIGSGALSITSQTGFCISCHEMRFVAEQGWKKSPHFDNEHGVVAQCADCHVPPGILSKVWTKTRDGTKDILVHLFGNTDIHKMDWKELGKLARSKIHDSACRKCHDSLTRKGPLKAIIAHRENQRLSRRRKKCLECHNQSFHGGFMDLIVSSLENKQKR